MKRRWRGFPGAFALNGKRSSMTVADCAWSCKRGTSRHGANNWADSGLPCRNCALLCGCFLVPVSMDAPWKTAQRLHGFFRLWTVPLLNLPVRVLIPRCRCVHAVDCGWRELMLAIPGDCQRTARLRFSGVCGIPGWGSRPVEAMGHRMAGSCAGAAGRSDGATDRSGAHSRWAGVLSPGGGVQTTASAHPWQGPYRGPGHGDHCFPLGRAGTGSGSRPRFGGLADHRSH